MYFTCMRARGARAARVIYYGVLHACMRARGARAARVIYYGEYRYLFTQLYSKNSKDDYLQCPEFRVFPSFLTL
jgi:hypothetical protein